MDDAIALDDEAYDELLDDIPSNPSEAFLLNSGLSEVYDADIEANGDSEGIEADKNSTPSISDGDFLDPEQHLTFVRLKKHIRDACNTNSRGDARKKAIEWIFVPGALDSKRIDFDKACRFLGARPDVVRVRTAHQLWKANIMLADPLPFLSHPPPISLMSEIATLLGHNPAVAMAREAWNWPSIPVAELRAKFADTPGPKYQAALEGLMAEGYLAIASARVYFIGRNPSLLSKGARERFSFSGSLYTE